MKKKENVKTIENTFFWINNSDFSPTVSWRRRQRKREQRPVEMSSSNSCFSFFRFFHSNCHMHFPFNFFLSFRRICSQATCTISNCVSNSIRLGIICIPSLYRRLDVFHRFQPYNRAKCMNSQNVTAGSGEQYWNTSNNNHISEMKTHAHPQNEHNN